MAINMFTKTIILAFCFILFFSILLAVTKQDNDLLFIIGLFENKQYELAKKQIERFEMENTGSHLSQAVVLVKANIAYSEQDYTFADSLYDILLTISDDEAVLAEALYQKAMISCNDNEAIHAINYLQQALSLSTKDDLRYQIYHMLGVVNYSLHRYEEAKKYLKEAINIKHNNLESTYYLMLVHISNSDFNSAQNLVSSIITSKGDNVSYSAVVNYWIDNMLAQGDYQALDNFEILSQQNGYSFDESTVLRLAKYHYLLRDFETSILLLKGTFKHEKYRKYIEGLIYKDRGYTDKADSIFADISRGLYFGDDFLTDSNENIVISAWLERIKILSDTYPEMALSELNKYRTNTPTEELNPFVLYVYGSILFERKQYQEAVQYLSEAKRITEDPELLHNVVIMLADIWNQAGVTEYAQQAYNNYLNQYPNGRFKSHALYSIAMIHYNNQQFNNAISEIQRLQADCSDPEILEKSNFMMAEISFAMGNYNIAIEQYKNLKLELLPKISRDFRLAQCYYLLGMFDDAAAAIQAQINIPEYNYKIYMLLGNIHLSQKKFTEAYESYKLAQSLAKSESEIQQSSSYVALTLYRLGRFDEATEEYLKLSREQDSSQDYLLMAAKTSYHAKDYSQALMLFQQYATENPDGKFIKSALANIGSIYYNRKEYQIAIKTWLDLLKEFQKYTSFNNDDQVILTGIFSGLQWCLKASPTQSYLDEVNDMIDKFSSEYVKFELQYLLLKTYFGTEQWDVIIQLADELREQFPKKENNEIRKYIAVSLSHLNRIEEADSVYNNIYKLEPSADVLTEWAVLDLQSGKTDNGITKLDQALTADTTAVRMTKLFQGIYDYKPAVMPDYWRKWSLLINPVPEKVKEIWMKWNFDNANWDNAQFTANDLLLSSDSGIGSEAQFVLSACKFYQADYENAITEFYRAIYLFPDNPELLIDSKYYIVKSYLGLNQLIEAEAILNEIADQLDNERRQELNSLIDEKRPNHE